MVDVTPVLLILLVAFLAWCEHRRDVAHANRRLDLIEFHRLYDEATERTVEADILLAAWRHGRADSDDVADALSIAYAASVKAQATYLRIGGER